MHKWKCINKKYRDVFKEQLPLRQCIAGSDASPLLLPLCPQAVQCWFRDGDGVDGGGSGPGCLPEEEQWRLQVHIKTNAVS